MDDLEGAGLGAFQKGADHLYLTMSSASPTVERSRLEIESKMVRMVPTTGHRALDVDPAGGHILPMSVVGDMVRIVETNDVHEFLSGARLRYSKKKIFEIRP